MLDGIRYVEDDLNNKDVVKIFNLLKGMGPEALIAMTDSNDDFLDRYDESVDDISNDVEYGNEIENLNLKLDPFVRMFGCDEKIGKNKFIKEINGKKQELIKISDDVAFVDGKFITIENGKIVEGRPTKIDKGAFYQCISFTSITIPDSVTEIGDSAFAECELLTSITIPNGVT